MDDVREQIETANRKFVQLFKRGNSMGISALYSMEARLMPPDAAMISGREAIEAFWRAAMKQGIKAVTLETLEVLTSGGDLATEIGRFTFTVEVQGGGRVEQVGKYIVIWRLEAGIWKLHADIWNADAPAGRG